MSGDVQPRKRKDKRRRKDELSIEEPRGTAAVFGEGDVFMHSQHEHGTGGHWCAKVIFFSLLAVLVTLIGLIILENRGLSELEANAVESKYSGVLEGWLEDSPDDDHHDVHTLELKHHDEEDDDQGDIMDDEHEDDDIEENNDQNDEVHEDTLDEGSDEIDEDERNGDDHEDEIQDDDDENEDRDQDDDDGDQDIDSAELEDDEDERNFKKYYDNVEQDRDDDEDDDEYNEELNNDESNENEDEQNDDSIEEGDNKSIENNDYSNNEDDESNQQLDDNDDEEDRDNESNEYKESYASRQSEEEGTDDDAEDDTDLKVEKIEKEVSDEDVLQEADADNSEEDKSAEKSDEDIPDDDQIADEEEFLELEDIEEPVVVERITAPAGKPLPEVDDETSSEKPLDTLAEEEEYEKQQEELRLQKEQQASHMWLKVAVGGALLVATHAVIRRATAPRDPILSAEREKREESPSAVDRRMTLIPEEPSTVTEEPEEMPPPTIARQVERVSSVMTKAVPLFSIETEEEEEDEELDFESKNVETAEPGNDNEAKELYSDEEIEEEVEQEVEVIKEIPKQSISETKQKTAKEVAKTIEPEIEPDEEVPEDVEIIDDEQLEEEIVEEEDEEDISDVDDAELLSRLEAKYGRLPEPERPTPKKDGGNNIDEDWPGEPSDQYWRQQLDEAERELRQGSWFAAEERAGAGELRGSARARYIRARALDAAAEAKRDNALLSRSIAAYLELLKMNERLSDKKLLEVTNRTLDRIRFRGNYIKAEPLYRLLIRRFPDDPSHRNNLTIAYLMANRPDLAEEVLKETLRIWPDDRIALAHLGFILKTTHNKLEQAVEAIRKALEGDIGAANEPRFYFHLGDALLLLGRFDEAHEVHKRGAKLGHFLSPAQRSLYNVERLKSQPWWDIEQTPYQRLARSLEASWQTILKEGEAARALYEQEKEGLKERGEWSQLDLFVRGQELPGRCKRAPITCSIVRQEIAAVGCKRGQIKFSAMEAGTHVRPHVGPTNCRLRMHLGLSNTKDTYIRVDKEIRQWQVGKVLLFDDSFEHEVWHNGTGARLVLIVDVWHPDLTHAERRQLPAI